MAVFDYARMQATATRLLTRFDQGIVQLLRSTPDTPNEATPWVPDEPSREIYELAATVRPVEQKYIDGTLIVGGEDQITFAVTAVAPDMSDTFLIDGRAVVLKDLRRIPAAGIPVAYIAFVVGSGGNAAQAVGQPSLDFTYPANSPYVALI